MMISVWKFILLFETEILKILLSEKSIFSWLSKATVKVSFTLQLLLPTSLTQGIPLSCVLVSASGCQFDFKMF